MMDDLIKKVFVVGGTGFLGYYSCLEFLKKDISVTTIVRDRTKLGEWFSKEIETIDSNIDIFDAKEEELTEIFQGFDAMIYSVGPDDRVLPDAPAYEFFHEKLVVQCSKVVRAARKAGVKKVVILNSYFAYFDRLMENKLSKRHPYIKARVEQAKACIDEGKENDMDVMILELPYIFGSIPNQIPLWKDVFLKKFENMKTVYFPKGGTVMVHVKDVAKAVVGATLNGKHGQRYPIGSTNMKFEKMLELMYEFLKEKKEIKIVPTSIAYLSGWFLFLKAKKEKKEGGLHYAKLMTDIMSKDFYFSKEVIQKVENDLNFKYSFDVVDGIKEAMEFSYP